jgi:hypothetical protein
MSIAFISALQETTLNILGGALAGWVTILRGLTYSINFLDIF